MAADPHEYQVIKKERVPCLGHPRQNPDRHHRLDPEPGS
jgi:hypothetical protein